MIFVYYTATENGVKKIPEQCQLDLVEMASWFGILLG
jgi:hypothetical protein